MAAQLLGEPNSILLQTRLKWSIPNELRPERPKAALEAALEMQKTDFPDAIFRSITATYNCMGMVVAARRVWVDPEDAAKILMDDGYRRLSGPLEVDLGDVVIYHNQKGEAVHIGIIMDRRVLVAAAEGDHLVVLSKWGADGEYIHDLSRLPVFLGKPSEYWSDRRKP